MKRTVKYLIASVLTLAFVLFFVPLRVYAEPDTDGCRGSQDGKHEWEEVTDNFDPGWSATCEEGGHIMYRCKKCGDYREEEVGPRGHVWDSGKVTKEATCTEAGENVYTCTRPLYQGKPCGATRTEVIPATGHRVIPIEGKAPTCTDTGLTEGQRCTVCGTILKAQEVILATGHQAVPIPGKPATCTESGLTEGQRCDVCGVVLSEQQTIPALGHDYEGVVTKEPEGFEPGVMTYTCKRDPSHTYTEEIAPETSLFGKLRNIPPAPSGMGPDPLVITKQPEGGGIHRNVGGKNYLHLTVEVEGGVGPYTYEWHRRDETLVEQALKDYLASIYKDEFQAITNAHGHKVSVIKEMWEWFYESKGVGSMTIDKNSEMQELVLEELDLLDHVEFTFENEPAECGFNARKGASSYYVVVYDSVGNHVKSDKVKVEWLLGIEEQPVSAVNAKNNEKVQVVACDGTQPYTYKWRVREENGAYGPIDGATKAEFQPTEDLIGRTIKVEIRDDTGDYVFSDSVLVYASNPLTIVETSGDRSLESGQEAELYVRYAGGYSLDGTTVTWYRDLDQAGNAETNQNVSKSSTWDRIDESRIKVSDPGTYTALIRDEVGNTVQAVFSVGNRKLKIKTEPKDTRLPYAGRDGTDPVSVKVNIVMEEGYAPFKYQLESAGVILAEQTDKNEFEITKPGLYSILVTDSLGATAHSRTFRVYEYDLTVTFTPVNPAIRTNSNQPYYAIARGEAEGGTGPYTYRWYKWDETQKTWVYSWKATMPVRNYGGGDISPFPAESMFENSMNNLAFYEVYDYQTFGYYFSKWAKIKNSDGYFYLVTSEPGKYCAGVKDATGAIAFSDFFDVSYKGPDPKIIVQPYSVGLSPTEKNTNITLTCDAYSAARDSDEFVGSRGHLIFRWEKWLGTGEWLSDHNVPGNDKWETVSEKVGSGTLNLGKLNDNQGYYRCRVKDIDSGPYGPFITSKTVSLKVDMLFRKSATKVFAVNGKNIQGLRFTFEGGSGPYRVVGILRNGEVYKIDRKDIQVTVSDKGKVYVDIMKELDLYHMNGSKNVIGYYEPYKYEIELKDQYGQTVWGSFKLPN